MPIIKLWKNKLLWIRPLDRNHQLLSGFGAKTFYPLLKTTQNNKDYDVETISMITLSKNLGLNSRPYPQTYPLTRPKHLQGTNTLAYWVCNKGNKVLRIWHLEPCSQHFVFYNSQMGPIIYGVYSRQVFPAYCNVTLYLLIPILS